MPSDVSVLKCNMDKPGNVCKNCNIGAFPCNHFLFGESISIIYAECVVLALRIQHAMLMSNIAICGPCGYTIFFHIISYTAYFRKIFGENKICDLFFSTTFI